MPLQQVGPVSSPFGAQSLAQYTLPNGQMFTSADVAKAGGGESAYQQLLRQWYPDAVGSAFPEGSTVQWVQGPAAPRATQGASSLFAAPSTPAPPAAPAGTTAIPPVSTAPGAGQLPPTATPPGYTPGSALPVAPSQTPADQFNALLDPTQAIYRGLIANGYNPDFQTWGVRQLLKRAEDMVFGAAGRAVQGGQADMLAGPGFQDMINELVFRAAQGNGGVISGPGEGRESLNAINRLLGVNNQQGTSLGAQFLNSQFGTDPSRAMNLVEALLYGNLNPTVRQAVATPLQAFPARFQQYVETPEGFAEATNRSVLDILLSQLIPTYKPLYFG